MRNLKQRDLALYTSCLVLPPAANYYACSIFKFLPCFFSDTILKISPTYMYVIALCLSGWALTDVCVGIASKSMTPSISSSLAEQGFLMRGLRTGQCKSANMTRWNPPSQPCKFALGSSGQTNCEMKSSDCQIFHWIWCRHYQPDGSDTNCTHFKTFWLIF